MPFDYNPSTFLWATGIENTFIPQARPGLRALDEYELTQHYKLWKRDFDLVAQTGVKVVRWGIPWYRVQPEPNRWDWRWVDEALDYLVTIKGIKPIIDLMHYGTPFWLDNSFINANYPQRVAEYAQAVAVRYKSLEPYYTPLNEPMVNAAQCGQIGEWPPYLTGDDGYVKLTLALAKGIALTMQALQAEHSDAVTVQVEALWKTFTQDDSLRAEAEAQDARQYLCFDLVTGRVDTHYALYSFLRNHGLTQADLDWFRQNAATLDIFGANFYPWSYQELVRKADGTTQRRSVRPHGSTIAEVLRAAYNRYALPIMVTETSANAPIAGRAKWMDETIAAVHNLREEGIPIIGYTWFPLFTMIDWRYRRARGALKKYLLHLGLYEAEFDARGTLRRRQTPLVRQYRQHITRSLPAIKS